MSDKAEPAFFIEPLSKQKGGFRFSFGNVYACLLVGTQDCFKCNIQRPAPPGLPFLCLQDRRYLWVMTRVQLGYESKGFLEYTPNVIEDQGFS